MSKLFLVDIWFEPKSVRISAKSEAEARKKARSRVSNGTIKPVIDKNCGIEVTEIYN